MHLVLAGCFSFLYELLSLKNKVDYIALHSGVGLGGFSIIFANHGETIDKIFVNVYNEVDGGGGCE